MSKSTGIQYEQSVSLPYGSYPLQVKWVPERGDAPIGSETGERCKIIPTKPPFDFGKYAFIPSDFGVDFFNKRLRDNLERTALNNKVGPSGNIDDPQYMLNWFGGEKELSDLVSKILMRLLKEDDVGVIENTLRRLIIEVKETQDPFEELPPSSLAVTSVNKLRKDVDRLMEDMKSYNLVSVAQQKKLHKVVKDVEERLPVAVGTMVENVSLEDMRKNYKVLENTVNTLVKQIEDIGTIQLKQTTRIGSDSSLDMVKQFLEEHVRHKTWNMYTMVEIVSKLYKVFGLLQMNIELLDKNKDVSGPSESFETFREDAKADFVEKDKVSAFMLKYNLNTNSTPYEILDALRTQTNVTMMSSHPGEYYRSVGENIVISKELEDGRYVHSMMMYTSVQYFRELQNLVTSIHTTLNRYLLELTRGSKSACTVDEYLSILYEDDVWKRTLVTTNLMVDEVANNNLPSNGYKINNVGKNVSALRDHVSKKAAEATKNVTELAPTTFDIDAALNALTSHNLTLYEELVTEQRDFVATLIKKLSNITKTSQLPSFSKEMDKSLNTYLSNFLTHPQCLSIEEMASFTITARLKIIMKIMDHYNDDRVTKLTLKNVKSELLASISEFATKGESRLKEAMVEVGNIIKRIENEIKRYDKVREDVTTLKLSMETHKSKIEKELEENRSKLATLGKKFNELSKEYDDIKTKVSKPTTLSKAQMPSRSTNLSLHKKINELAETVKSDGNALAVKLDNLDEKVSNLKKRSDVEKEEIKKLSESKSKNTAEIQSIEKRMKDIMLSKEEQNTLATLRTNNLHLNQRINKVNQKLTATLLVIREQSTELQSLKKTSEQMNQLQSQIDAHKSAVSVATKKVDELTTSLPATESNFSEIISILKAVLDQQGQMHALVDVLRNRNDNLVGGAKRLKAVEVLTKKAENKILFSRLESERAAIDTMWSLHKGMRENLEKHNISRMKNLLAQMMKITGAFDSEAQTTFTTYADLVTQYQTKGGVSEVTLKNKLDNLMYRTLMTEIIDTPKSSQYGDSVLKLYYNIGHVLSYSTERAIKIASKPSLLSTVGGIVTDELVMGGNLLAETIKKQSETNPIGFKKWMEDNKTIQKHYKTAKSVLLDEESVKKRSQYVTEVVNAIKTYEPEPVPVEEEEEKKETGNWWLTSIFSGGVVKKQEPVTVEKDPVTQELKPKEQPAPASKPREIIQREGDINEQVQLFEKKLNTLKKRVYKLGETTGQVTTPSPQAHLPPPGRMIPTGSN